MSPDFLRNYETMPPAFGAWLVLITDPDPQLIPTATTDIDSIWLRALLLPYKEATKVRFERLAFTSARSYITFKPDEDITVYGMLLLTEEHLLAVLRYAPEDWVVVPKGSDMTVQFADAICKVFT